MSFKIILNESEIDQFGILIHTTSPGQSGLESNDNEVMASHSQKMQNWKLTTRCNLICLFVYLFGLFICFGISTFAGYLMPIHLYTNKQFYSKQLSLA